jgi:hypothetical protein
MEFMVGRCGWVGGGEGVVCVDVGESIRYSNHWADLHRVVRSPLARLPQYSRNINSTSSGLSRRAPSGVEGHSGGILLWGFPGLLMAWWHKASFWVGGALLDLRFRGPLEAKSFVRAPKIDRPGAPGRALHLKCRSCGYDCRCIHFDVGGFSTDFWLLHPPHETMSSRTSVENLPKSKRIESQTIWICPIRSLGRTWGPAGVWGSIF